MKEPILNKEDRRIWNQLEKTALVYSKTTKHEKRVNTAQRYVDEMIQRCGENNVWSAWSAGKDSTAMVHLIAMLGFDVPSMSVKDDLDYPGEEQYVLELAEAFGIQTTIVHPPFSLQEWIRTHAINIDAGNDMHSRSAALSKDAFYSVIEKFRVERNVDGIFLGLRKYESVHRMKNRTKRSPIYRKMDGQWVCQPICDWEGLDVYAYLLCREIPLFDVYRCLRFAEKPWEVRKSWWLPGKSATKNQTVWLKAYYPSLYQRMLEIFPQGGQMA